MTGRVEWSDVLNGRGYLPRPVTGRTADEQRQLRDEFEQRMDQADVSAGLIPGAWRRKREELAKLAAESRGAWFGSGGHGCPECSVEKRSAEDGSGMHIDTVDHTHWREDKRLEQRLADHARIMRAEAAGDIRQGSFYQNRPLDPVAEQMAEYERSRMEAAQLRQQARLLANPPMRGTEAL